MDNQELRKHVLEALRQQNPPDEKEHHGDEEEERGGTSVQIGVYRRVRLRVLICRSSSSPSGSSHTVVSSTDEWDVSSALSYGVRFDR